MLRRKTVVCWFSLVLGLVIVSRASAEVVTYSSRAVFNASIVHPKTTLDYSGVSISTPPGYAYWNPTYTNSGVSFTTSAAPNSYPMMFEAGYSGYPLRVVVWNDAQDMIATLPDHVVAVGIDLYSDAAQGVNTLTRVTFSNDTTQDFTLPSVTRGTPAFLGVENRQPGVSITSITFYRSSGGSQPMAVVSPGIGTFTYATNALSRGRQIILNRGVMLGAGGVFRANNPPNYLNVLQYLSANYTLLDMYVDEYYLENGLPEGSLFGHWNAEYRGPMYYSPTYYHTLSAINYEDEPGPHTHPGEEPLLYRTEYIGGFYAWWRNYFPNALMYLSTASLREYTYNSSGEGGTEAGLRIYTQESKPDMLIYCNYPEYGFGEDARSSWYSNMAVFRKVGLEGWDGTGDHPIVNGQYMRMYRTSYTDSDLPSDSYVRMSRFTSLAAGFTFLEDYVYGYNGGDYPVMFSGDNQTPSTSVFGYVQASNAEINKLSPILKYLKSTAFCMVPGIHRHWEYTPFWPFGGHWEYYTNSVPDYIQTWSSGSGGENRVTNIQWISELGQSGDCRSDIVVGYFEPIRNYDIAAWAGGTHFMIVNGAGVGSPASSRNMVVRVTMNLSSSTYELQRINRTTGNVETVAKTSDGGTVYHCDITLPGGTGDLFRICQP
jgi:hypothetical protein